MAYSMFECPKLQNARSLKLYPEEYDHPVSFRHKNLPPDFELTDHPKSDENYSLHPQNSSHKKCPIYVHHFNSKINYDGDFVPKTHKKSKNKQKAVLEKLEETYWANWKPDRNEKKSNISTPPMKPSKSPEIHVIKSAPRRRKIKMYPKSEEETLIEKIEKEKVKKSQEIQTDICEKIVEEEIPVVKTSVEEIPPEEVEDNKFLKHTDSFILNSKKQKEEKENFEQPKCIRLYRKPGKNSSRNVVRGGSYPLKSCLKKDSNFSKTSSKLQRPGSPIISNFSSKGKFNKSHRH